MHAKYSGILLCKSRLGATHLEKKCKTAAWTWWRCFGSWTKLQRVAAERWCKGLQGARVCSHSARNSLANFEQIALSLAPVLPPVIHGLARIRLATTESSTSSLRFITLHTSEPLSENLSATAACAALPHMRLLRLHAIGICQPDLASQGVP